MSKVVSHEKFKSHIRILEEILTSHLVKSPLSEEPKLYGLDLKLFSKIAENYEIKLVLKTEE